MKIQTSEFCTNPEDCPQCLAKAKFNIGNNKKCIKHSFLPQENNNNSTSYSKQELLDQIIYGLEDVEKMIIQYKTKYISISNSKNSLQSKTTLVNESTCCLLQLQDAFIIMKRIQALLGSGSQVESRNQTFDSFSKHEASYRTKSQKQLKQPEALNKNKIFIQTSEFRQDNEVKNYIKQWVQHFTNFLNKQNQSSGLSNLKLPLLNTIEMKSFYKQIQTIYKGYRTKNEEKDKQFNQLINKLAQYIEKDKRKMANIQQNKFMQKYVNTITPPRPQKINQASNSKQKRSKTPNSKKSSQLIDASIILPNEYCIAESSQQMEKLLFAQACSIQSLLTRIDQIQKQQQLALN